MTALIVLLCGCAVDTELETLVAEARASATSAGVRPQTQGYTPAQTAVPGLAYTPSFSPESSDGVDGVLARMLYARLYTLDETGRAIESLVRVHSVTETGEHRFSLKAGMTFTDGTELTLADVVYSLRLAGFDASADGKTLVIAGQPDAGLPARLSAVPFLRVGTANRDFPTPSGEYAVIDGALVNRAGEVCYTLVPVASAREALTAYQAGEVHTLTVFGSEPDAVFPHGRAYVDEVPSRILYSLTFRADSGLFSHLPVRLAAAAAIDRTAFASEWLEPAFTFAPSWSYLWTPALEQDALDLLDRSRADLWGSVSLLVCDDAGTLSDMAETIKAQLCAAGMAVTVDACPPAAYQAALDAGEYDLLLRRTELPPDFSPAALVGEDIAASYLVDCTPEAFADMQKVLSEECIVTPIACAKGRSYTHIE
ncbi:MAG: ABC transporter substrate-binding protein [Clostridiaceae bacterium]|nr:ABC transporter substrate-binding protein [Clostridiaceae bacterium]